MQPMSRSERSALCNSALEAGQDAPTLCEGWSVKDLVVHLVVRERHPLGATGIVAPPLSFLTTRTSRALARQDFTALVERVRSGPPVWSPMALPPVERAANTLEFFVHHEDVRRAAPSWEPRELTTTEQGALWRSLAVAGRGAVRSSGVPVQLRWPGAPEGTGATTLRSGADPVVVSGEPSEVAMLLLGRDQHRGVTVEGPPDGVRRLRGSDLGL
ncbi:TIGR03085 family protein [Nocardioides scoriae]|uniref:TIGR03085 family protein n=1 Tax=Nocardioides scoriae TaxID=642780 RepID=A0A1H1QLB4_9ACTN|nr:TIGR03085 family metal-binding protein [Nocardioides scoriae]SDS24176.1 TIGR03085 family protein [Nocardioides scoriae]